MHSSVKGTTTYLEFVKKKNSIVSHLTLSKQLAKCVCFICEQPSVPCVACILIKCKEI